MKAPELSVGERELIAAIVERYAMTDLEKAERLADALFSLASSKDLFAHVHSLRKRAKDPGHLSDKLERKMQKCKEAGVPFPVTPENVFETINDLAGIRILHLHTSQFPEINRILLGLLEIEEYEIREGPIAKVWDGEYEQIFKQYGIKTETNPRMYTSVHYVVGVGARQVRTAEIQVRTLAEELWGEVDHSINYPHASTVLSCQEQIKVLARVTSSCTRLVDSIFVSEREAASKS